MSSEPLLHVGVETDPGAAKDVSAVLEQVFQTPAVVYHDLEAERCQVSVYPPAADVDRRTRRAELKEALAALNRAQLVPLPGRITFRTLKPRDWSESWKRHFTPIEIAGALLIKTSWSRRRPKAGVRVIMLDPGLSFGTGHHPTTRFCLEQVAAVTRRGGSFLDVGTGSGILAMAAAKLGFRTVEAFDFDPDAVRIATGNARRNRISRIQFRVADVCRLPVRGRRFDLVCANLTHDLLVGECRRLAGRVAKDGRLVLAGILNQQFDAVACAYRRQGMVFTRRETQDEWTSAVFRFDDWQSRR